MANAIELYRTYDEKLANLVEPKFEMTAYYVDEDLTEVELLFEDSGTVLILDNEKKTWAYDEYGFGINGKVVLQNITPLFGEEGLMNEDAMIGIALKWTSKTSSQQGLYPLEDSRTLSTGELEIPFNYQFCPGVLYGQVNISLILYVKEPSEKKTLGKANIPGMILGKMHEWTIALDGSSSTFPIECIEDPTKPLWFVQFNIEDPLSDPFNSESVCIYFNKAHPGFAYLEKTNQKVASYLQTEVMASAIQLLLLKVMELDEWDEIEKGKNFSDGTIAQAVSYFLTTFDWDYSTTEKLAASIRKDFENREKRGELDEME